MNNLGCLKRQAVHVTNHLLTFFISPLPWICKIKKDPDLLNYVLAQEWRDAGDFFCDSIGF